MHILESRQPTTAPSRVMRVNTVITRFSKIFAKNITDEALTFFEHYPDPLEKMAILLAKIEVRGVHRSMNRVQAYIFENYAGTLRIKETARIAGMSPFYFSRLFKRHMGLKFTEFVAGIRVERAKVLLCVPNQRLFEIAFDTGFKTQDQLYRTFKRIVGMSPTKYRENLKVKFKAKAV